MPRLALTPLPIEPFAAAQPVRSAPGAGYRLGDGPTFERGAWASHLASPAQPREPLSGSAQQALAISRRTCLMESRRRLAAPRTMRALATVALGALALTGGRAAAQAPEKEGPPKTEVTVGYSYKNDVTPPLRDMPAIPFRLQPEREMLEPKGFPVKDFSAPDPVVQRSLAPAAMPGTILNFDGIGFPGVACNCSPARHQRRGGRHAVRPDRQHRGPGLQQDDGRVPAGPRSTSPHCGRASAGCARLQGQGDPVVLYDQLANRWVVDPVSPARSRSPTSASRSRRRATPPAPGIATASTSAATSTTTPSWASGPTRTTCR